MVEKRDRTFTPLKTVADLASAQEWLFNEQKNGVIDSKTADGLNTTLKGCMYLKATLPLKIFECMIRASVKKVEIPQGLLPVIGQLSGSGS